MSNFIAIPSNDGSIYHIDMFDILNIIQYPNGNVDVTYALKDRVCSLTTSIPAQEIIEKIDKAPSIFGLFDNDEDGE